MIVVAPDANGFALAVEALNRDDIVAYPTETVYGLAVNPFSENAIDKLFAAKKRDPHHPILVIIADQKQLPQVAQAANANAAPYIDAFWPGPLTLLLPIANALPKRLTAGVPKIAVRCPASNIARDLCLAFGGPITSTSANISGALPADAINAIDVPGIALAIDGGKLPKAPPSTIFDPEENTILRLGPISERALHTAIQKNPS